MDPKKIRPLRGLWPFIAPYKGTLTFAAITLLLAAAATLLLPVAVKYMIDFGFGEGPPSQRYFYFLMALAIVLAISSALRFYLVSWLGERVVADIRSRVYRHVISMSPTFFEVTRTGEVLSRLTTDTALVQTVAGVGISITLRSLVTLTGGTVMLFFTSPRLTLMLFLCLPLVLVPLTVLGRRVRRLSRATQDRIADSSGIAGETLNAIQTVQAFSLEDLQGERFDESVGDSFATGVRRIRVRALLSGVAITIVFGAIVAALWAGAGAVEAGEMSGGDLGQFLLYSIFVAGAAASLGEVWGDVQRAAGAMERLMELLDARPDIVSPPQPKNMPEPGTGEIRFVGVSFLYPSRPNDPALTDFALDIHSGETIALVGPSGAGKSTVFQLMLRFYDPNAGRIFVDGVDLAQADPDVVRSRIGIVPQETMVFAESVLENIRYGRSDASDEEVVAAAKAAAADEFIVTLPEGYNTFVGERGTRLSGGQKQRIAIARALLKDPPIMLLDEATSALDAESERLVQQALNRLMAGRTTLVIAHRLATVLRADRIVVMEAGRIVAIGTHESLLQQTGLYARLAELQFGPTEPELGALSA